MIDPDGSGTQWNGSSNVVRTTYGSGNGWIWIR